MRLLKIFFVVAVAALLIVALANAVCSIRTGEISFATTLVLCVAAALLVSAAGRVMKLPHEVYLLFYSLLFSFLTAEFFLRYVYCYPATYSEQNGRGFISEYYMQEYQNEQFLKDKQGKTDLYTREYDSFEMRDIANAEGITRPLEKYNHLGLRGALPVKNKKVIACFGDSFTEGACVTIDSSYPQLLQNYLSAAGKETEVLNAGISGNDPYFDFKMLQKLQPRFNITTAIFLVNYTDINDIMHRGGSIRFAPNGTVHLVPVPWWERLYGLSYVFRLIAHRLAHLDFCYHTAAQHAQSEAQARQLVYQLFADEIIPYCQEHRIQVVIATHPLEMELTDGNAYYKWAAPLLQLQNCKTVDLFSLIAEANKEARLYYKVDGHFYGKGYDLIAREIFAALQ